MRTIQQKPHYTSQKHSPPVTSLTLPLTTIPLTTRLLSHKQNYSPFLSPVTKGELLRGCHLIVLLKARSIIIILSTSRRIQGRITLGRRNEATKVRLLLSNPANLGVHLTHIISKMVKTSTKIILNELKLIQDARDASTLEEEGVVDEEEGREA